MITKEKLAEMLNGRQYRDETTPEIERLAKESGLCIIFGASDDLLEFRGTVYDEVGAYNGAVVYLTPKGKIKEKSKHDRIEITASWCPGPPLQEIWASWLIEPSSNIPFSPFEIFEDGDLYCRGAIFEFNPHAKNALK